MALCQSKYKLHAKHAVMTPYQKSAVTLESAEKQGPRLLPTHTIGCNNTHMAGPNIFHPRANNITTCSKQSLGID